MADTISSSFDVVLSDDFSQGYKVENWGYAFDGGTYWNGAFEWSNDDVAVRDRESELLVGGHRRDVVALDVELDGLQPEPGEVRQPDGSMFTE